MTHSIPPEKMAIYRETARKREQQRREKLALLQQKGWTVAREAAKLLKTEFQAEKVAIFGSMLNCDRLHEQSDLDLAVWGLNPKYYYRAVSHLLSLDPSLSVDLVEIESASPRLLTSIEQEGIFL